MRSRFLSATGALLAASTLLYLGASCLKLDTDRSCGAGEPPCYQGEVCHRGRCYERGNVPSGGDMKSSDTSVDRDSTDTTSPIDTTATDAGANRPDLDSGSRDADAEERDADTYGHHDATPGHCGRLRARLDGGLGGLRREWNYRADAGTDAGPLPGHPGAKCMSEADCQGKCLKVTTGRKRCVHRIFTSSKSYDGDFEVDSSPLSGLRQADCACQLLAERAGLDGIWRAVLSGPNKSMKERIAIREHVYRMTYESPWTNRQAADRNNFFGSGITQDIDYDESKSQIDPNEYAWTGWKAPKNSSCDGWDTADSTKNGTVGDPDQDPISWYMSRPSEYPCSERHHLYCIEQ